MADSSVVGRLADLLHRSLVTVSAALGGPYQGLAMAAGEARRMKYISPRLEKKLRHLEIATHWARHCTAEKSMEFEAELQAELAGGPMKASKKPRNSRPKGLQAEMMRLSERVGFLEAELASAVAQRSGRAWKAKAPPAVDSPRTSLGTGLNGDDSNLSAAEVTADPDSCSTTSGAACSVGGASQALHLELEAAKFDVAIQVDFDMQKLVSDYEAKLAEQLLRSEQQTAYFVAKLVFFEARWAQQEHLGGKGAGLCTCS